MQQASMGKRVVVIQFLKAKGITDSEFLKRLEPEIKFFRFERSQEDYLDRSAEEKKEAEVNIRRHELCQKGAHHRGMRPSGTG